MPNAADDELLFKVCFSLVVALHDSDLDPLAIVLAQESKIEERPEYHKMMEQVLPTLVGSKEYNNYLLPTEIWWSDFFEQYLEDAGIYDAKDMLNYSDEV